MARELEQRARAVHETAVGQPGHMLRRERRLSELTHEIVVTAPLREILTLRLQLEDARPAATATKRRAARGARAAHHEPRTPDLATPWPEIWPAYQCIGVAG